METKPFLCYNLCIHVKRIKTIRKPWQSLFAYLVRREGETITARRILAYPLVFCLLGLLPCLRFLFLLNHSFMHFFFTSRALLSSFLAAALIMEELLSRKETDPRRKKRRS